jgi:hypothetical protein
MSRHFDMEGIRAIGNPFEIALAEGRLIESVAVEKNLDKDDDWLTFHLGEPDPAIFRFHVPTNMSHDDPGTQSSGVKPPEPT